MRVNVEQHLHLALHYGIFYNNSCTKWYTISDTVSFLSVFLSFPLYILSNDSERETNVDKKKTRTKPKHS